MEAAEYLIKCATTRWKELVRTGKLSGDAAGALFRHNVLNKDYMLANSMRNSQRGLTWEDILRPAGLGAVHKPFAANYLEAVKQLPASIKPVRMLGVGGESLAVKTRDGNVLKLTLSGKPVAPPRAFDAPVLNPGGVIKTQNDVPVQWHVQPKLDILSKPNTDSFSKAPTQVSTTSPNYGLPLPAKLTGSELPAQRFIKQHARGAMKPTDVYPQNWAGGAGGTPMLHAAPKVEQFGRMPDGRLVLADRGAISQHANINEAVLGGEFNGPQVFGPAKSLPESGISLSALPE